MPELPEVHTTVEGIKKTAVGQKIIDVWSDFYVSTSHGEGQTIKNKKYFERFRKLVRGAKIKSAERRGKNILVNLDPSASSGQVAYTIIIHMKMTGHVMYGKYEFRNKKWRAVEEGPLQDPFNQFIHLVFTLSSGKQLILSDMRKFASVTITETDKMHKHKSVGVLGPEPLSSTLKAKKLSEIIKKRGNMPIKSALLDQTALAGIGNIYSDEILWATSIHPLSPARSVPESKFAAILQVMREILKFSIKHGGDSKSDYRNIFGEKGGFQNFHKAYGQKNKKCSKKNCKGIISRIVVKGRSAHFCPVHQKLYK